MSSEWKKTLFKNLLLAPVKNGIYKEKEFHGRGCKIVNMGELFANSKLYNIDMKRVELSDKEKMGFLLNKGDLLFARRSLTAEGAGKCSLVKDIKEETTFESSIIRARPDPSKAHSDYLYYYFSSPQGRWSLGTILRQVAVSGITGKDLQGLEVLTPPLPEQKAIAHILGSLDDKIENNRRMNATLEAMAQALFKSWFVDFDPVRAKAEGREPEGMDTATAALFPDRLVNSELGEVPEGWGVCTFTDVITVVGGGTPKTSVEEYWNGDIPWFSVVDAPNESDVFVIDTEKKITQAGVENSSTNILPEGTTIVSARGTVGKLALVGTPMAMNQSCYGLQGNDLGAYFTFYTTKNLVDLLSQHSHGSVFSTITRATLDSLKVINPEKDILLIFEKKNFSIMGQIKNNLLQNVVLSQLRDTLLPKLISGELRVKDAISTFEKTV